MRPAHRFFSSLSVCAGAAYGAFFLSPAQAQAAPCYIAYIHGSGSQLQNNTTHEGFYNDGDSIEKYWNPDSAASTYDSFTYRSSKGWAGAQACAIYRVGYNGLSSWWADDAAGVVASQINDFISEYNIADGNLIIVTHSMGGIVGRWILDNGVGNAPYYNYNGDYARIVQKTKYMISVDAPHGGTQVADAIYGEADHYFSDAAGVMALWFGGQDRSDARNSLRRNYMSDAANWMGDAGRYSTIYTVAGNSVDDDAGEGMGDDGSLQTAWAGVCYRRAWFNGEGSLCGSACVYFPLVGCIFTAATFSNTAGDGLVELWSGNGYRRSGALIQGAYTKWLEIHDNHNQGRYDKHYGAVKDLLSQTTQNNYPGTYIADHGLNLPCSSARCITPHY